MVPFDFNGLYLLVRKNGSKLWRLAYRFEGKQKGIALGAYPEVTLAEARDRRDTARKLLANGKDPSLERRLEKWPARPKAIPSAKSPRSCWTNIRGHPNSKMVLVTLVSPIMFVPVAAQIVLGRGRFGRLHWY